MTDRVEKNKHIRLNLQKSNGLDRCLQNNFTQTPENIHSFQQHIETFIIDYILGQIAMNSKIMR